jgi:glucosamine-6-phosphate deaminase
MNLLTTLAGSLMEGFLPKGWDLARIDALTGLPPESITDRQPWWHDRFEPIPCRTVDDFDIMLGHEIAQAIRRTRDQGRPLAIILPVGPMGMYRWAVYFLREWGTPCDHVHGFNMDEWSDAAGNTLPSSNPGAFQNAMESAFYGPLGSLSVRTENRWFATPSRLPHYAERIADLKRDGAEIALVFGIGRVCHIAFWEPHFAAEFDSAEAWRGPPHPGGARSSTRSRSSKTP